MMTFKVRNWLFPMRCLKCGEEDQEEMLCGKCLAGIKINQTLFCGECRARLADNKKICHKDFPYILGAATDYEGVVNDLITGMKFKFWKEAGRPLQKILVSYAKNLPIDWKKSIVIPIPLSTQRERERGFNQSAILAATLQDNFGAKVYEGLTRVKNSKPQSETDFYKRRENVLGVFQVKNNSDLVGKKVILVDDVVTSGATFLEAAKVLKEADVRSVVAIAVAAA